MAITHMTQNSPNFILVTCGWKPKNRGVSPKMDGLFHGKPYKKMDDLGGKPTIFGNIHVGHWFGTNLR